MRIGRLSRRMGPAGQDRRAWVLAGMLLNLLAGSGSAISEPPTGEPGAREPGVVVEEAAEGSALARAGLEPDDVLHAWERLPAPANPEPAEGVIRSPFDWEWVKAEQAPRGTVRLGGEREGEARVWTVEPGLWEARVRPIMPALEEYRRGRESAESGDVESSAASWEKLAEPEMAGNLRCWLDLQLGNAWAEVQAWEKAHSAYRKALEATRDPVAQVVVWRASGQIYIGQSEFDRAEASLESALVLTRETWGESLGLAVDINKLGNVAFNRGRLDRAAEYYQRALEIREKLAPDSLTLADSLNNIGNIMVLRGQLGGSHWVKAEFRARNRTYYHNAMELLLSQKDRQEDAFAILERFRAQSFLTMLEERELLFSDIPDELDRRRRQLAVRHDRILGRLASLSATQDREKVEALRSELTDLYQERDELRAKIREASPRLANLREPETLGLARVREVLDRGTVMLSYSIAEKRTDLFVVTPDRGLTVHTLPVGEAELAAEVEDLRKLIKTKLDSPLGPMSRKGFETLSRRLYRSLVEPAADVVTTAERIVLVPDGSLHLLPFAALIRETGTDGSSDRDWQYFAEWKPLHSVLSATVYAELKQTRRTGAPDSEPLLVALGDPDYALNGERDDRDPVTDVRVRSSRERCGFDLDRLPGSRREVLGIAGLYRNVRTFLGQGAREENVKTLDTDARILHIAAHGCLDDRLPLNSGLFLTLPEGFPEGRDNGLLQAWEIFESVRLDADLVVLSACESGLGQDQGGEGLISLTRAFQYAGARTVAASLWQVDDQVTAELMVRFYRHLQGGKSTDAALQAAQVELIRRPIEILDEHGQVQEVDASAPYHWAAFQLLGDWR